MTILGASGDASVKGEGGSSGIGEGDRSDTDTYETVEVSSNDVSVNGRGRSRATTTTRRYNPVSGRTEVTTERILRQFDRDSENGMTESDISDDRAIKDQKKQQSIFKRQAEATARQIDFASSNQKMVGTIEPVQKPRGFIEKSRDRLNRERFKAFRARSKGKPQGGKEFLTGLEASGLSTLAFGTEFVKAPVKTTKETFSNLVSVAKDIPKKGLPKIGQTLRQEPLFSAGFVAGEVAQTYLFGKGVKSISNLGELASARLSPKYVKTTDELVKGVKLSSGELTDIKVAKGVASTSQSLPSQTRLAGRSTQGVSAQRGLFSPFKKEVVVDKPLPTPDSPPLEKSFFADPLNRLRTSRLGIQTQKEAGILDYLTGDVTFKKQRPQAFIFPKTKIEKFPSALKDVKTSLLSGKALTPTQEKRLLDFQLKPSGKFKPVGFLSRESEITLAPGETIVKRKKAATTIINRRRVDVFEAEVKQPKKTSLSALDDTKLKRGKKTTLLSESLEVSRKPRARVSGGVSRILRSSKPSSLSVLSLSRTKSRKGSNGFSSPIGGSSGLFSGLSGFVSGGSYGGFSGGSSGLFSSPKAKGGLSPILRTPPFTPRYPTPPPYKGRKRKRKLPTNKFSSKDLIGGNFKYVKSLVQEIIPTARKKGVRRPKFVSGLEVRV